MLARPVIRNRTNRLGSRSVKSRCLPDPIVDTDTRAVNQLTIGGQPKWPCRLNHRDRHCDSVYILYGIINCRGGGGRAPPRGLIAAIKAVGGVIKYTVLGEVLLS